MKKKTTKMLTVVLATLLFCGTLALVGCTKKLTDSPLNATIIADYTKTAAERTETFESGGWENGEPFNAWWKASNVSFDNNRMTLSISDMPVKEKVTNSAGEMVDCLSDYYGGEERSTHFYGYGDFKVKMKPSKVLGTASAFFTCTGNYDQWYDKDNNVIKTNDHDEIDIEFLGKDTTKVQFNYFASGVGGHEYMYDLGFDAAEEFHEYGFRWTKDDITWFVDNKPVYKVERSKIKKGEEWPEEPGRIIMNHWVGTDKASAWMGAFADDFSGNAEYLYAASSATPQKDPITTKPGNEPQPGEPIPSDIAWDETMFVPFTSADNTIYTVTADESNKKNTVTYTKVDKNSWKNVGTPIVVPGRNHFGVTFTSKTDKPANVRINLLDSEVKHLVKRSYVSEGTTTISDGAFVTVPANGSVDVAIYYEGTLAAVELMIDSTNLATDDTNANTIEITNTKFGVKGDVIESEPSKNDGVKIGENLVKFAGSPYTIQTNEDSSTMTVKYADLSGKSYSSIVGDVSKFIGTSYNTFTFKITNNGAQIAKLRVDIDCTTGEGTPSQSGKNNFCNTSATIVGALENGNDYLYGGGDWMKIAAGATATVTIRFTTEVGANAVRFFIDSSSYDDETTHTGEMMFSEMKFETLA